MVPPAGMDLRRQTIMDTTNALVSQRRLLRINTERPRFTPDHQMAYEMEQDAITKLAAAIEVNTAALESLGNLDKI